jgi:hypothetical protein
MSAERLTSLGLANGWRIPARSRDLDHGWQNVAQTPLDFVKRFIHAKPS